MEEEKLRAMYTSEDWLSNVARWLSDYHWETFRVLAPRLVGLSACSTMGPSQCKGSDYSSMVAACHLSRS